MWKIEIFAVRLIRCKLLNTLRQSLFLRKYFCEKFFEFPWRKFISFSSVSILILSFVRTANRFGTFSISFFSGLNYKIFNFVYWIIYEYQFYKFISCFYENFIAAAAGVAFLTANLFMQLWIVKHLKQNFWYSELQVDFYCSESINFKINKNASTLFRKKYFQSFGCCWNI